MVELATAKDMVRRLKGRRGYKDLSDYIKEQMAAALVEHCADKDHADRTIREGLKTWDFCPTIPELIAMAKSLPREAKRIGCSRCNPPGWIHFERAGIQCSRMCDCHPGRSGRREP